MKNNSQKIPLLISVISFIILSVFFVFLYKKMDENNQKAEQDTIKWQREVNRLDEIKSLNQSIKTVTTNKTALETHFIKSSDVVPFLDAIEGMAPKVGATAQVDSVGTQVNNSQLVVGIKVSGYFDAIYKFITLLENSPYEVEVLTLDIHKVSAEVVSGKNSASANPKWEASLKIQLLSFVK